MQTAEDLDFYSLLIPTRFANGLFAEDAPLAETWTTATALAAVTKRIRFLIAVRPGFVALGLFAQMAAALHQISKGRIDINIVPGGIQNDFERVGEFTDQSTRYERAEEFISACRKLWTQPGPVEFQGEHYKLKDAFCSPIPEGQPPQFYLGGASPRANALSGRQADVHLNWIEPLADSAARFDAVREEFKNAGRTPGLGIRTHLVVRDKEEDAWKAANELIDHADLAVKAQRKAAVAGTALVGAAAQAQEAVNHIVAPHLWNGLSEVRVNCGTAIVGTPEQVTDVLMGYWKLGVDEFILSGFPHVEECQRVAADVLPLLREKMAGA
ncbi:Alkanesulfonate monooxygenase [hydrothermal vent metagenome]|uniref:Alkanesulfonate monooxygenase n=1 Tax=hydrothermal vent metagenome TaxID=652676 RepID=A0A160VD37_9ZZZZ